MKPFDRNYFCAVARPAFDGDASILSDHALT
jgi:hypothetical protein